MILLVNGEPLGRERVQLPVGEISTPHKLGFLQISKPLLLLPSNVQILNSMLINLFIIVFILLVILCVWQSNKINKNKVVSFLACQHYDFSSSGKTPL